MQIIRHIIRGRDIVLEGDVYVAVGKYQYEKYENGSIINIKNECPYCGKMKSYKAKMCVECRNKENAKNIPPKEELYNLLSDNSMCAIGRMYGVSDNAVRKWCKKYNLPVNKKDIEKEFGIVKEKKKKGEPTPCKPVDMLSVETNELLRVFHSVYEAGVFLGDKKRRQHIVDVCNGKDNRNTAYGYKWRWHDGSTEEVAS